MSGWLAEARRLDEAVYAAVAASETPRLDGALRRLTSTADHGVLWFGVAGALSLLGGRRGRAAATRGLLGLGIASALANLVAKPLGGRGRPARPESGELARRHVPMPRSSSFPSGHTASAFAFATAAGSAIPVLGAPLGALATLVGYSRVHTGVHYPGDVLAGAVIGLGAAQTAGRLADRRK